MDCKCLCLVSNVIKASTYTHTHLPQKFISTDRAREKNDKDTVKQRELHNAPGNFLVHGSTGP